MEPIETRTEGIAEQIAADVDRVNETVAEPIGKTEVVQNDSAKVTAETTDDSPETIENIVEEAVVESTAVTLTDTEVDTAEIDTIETAATTEQPEESSDHSSCLLSNCPDWALIGGGILIIAIFAVIVIKYSKKKTGSQPAKKTNGKPNGSDVVEIYAGNLSYDMTDNQLRKEFERFGVVKSARVVTHRTNNKSKGYGFVEMPHRKEALIAIKALENADVMGRRIRVNEARANTRPPER